MKNFVNRAIVAAATLSPAILLAEGEATGGGSYSIDTSTVTEMLTGAQSSVSSFVSSAMPILGGIACAFAAFFLALIGWKLLKRFINRAA